MNDRFEELASVWLAKAEDDLAWAKDTLVDNRFGSVCFLCQQVAEKALKSFLFFRRQKLIRTHNLPLLNEKCKHFDADFSELDDAVDTLNNYYTDTRYPDIWDHTRFEDKNLAKEAFLFAEHIARFIRGKENTHDTYS